jgi:hypothetical protein
MQQLEPILISLLSVKLPTSTFLETFRGNHSEAIRFRLGLIGHSLKFPLLVRVDSVLKIIGSHGLDINFPALRNASGMHIAGHFSSYRGNLP